MAKAAFEESEPPNPRGRRAVGLALVVGLLGLGAWLLGLGRRPRTFSEQAAEPARSDASDSVSPEYTPAERRTLLELARRSLELVVREGRLPDLPASLPSHFSAEKGCFVTLTKRGQLRGCIGHIFPEQPLAKAVMHNARSAALHDPRFSAVTADELAQIEVEVSVLTVPRPLAFSSSADLLQKLHPHQDGVVLTVRGRRSTFLPQVWEQLPIPENFLDHLSAKAGAPREAWREPGTQIMTYRVEAFQESGLFNASSG